MKKTGGEKKESVWSVLAQPGSSPENLSHWTWACGCVSAAETSGLPQVNRTSHWIMLTGQDLGQPVTGQSVFLSSKISLFPGLGHPLYHISKYAQTGASKVIPAVTWASCSVFISQLPWHPTNNTGNRSCSISPPSCTPSWVSGLQPGRQPAR